MFLEIVAVISGVFIICDCISACVESKYKYQNTCCCNTCPYRGECMEVCVLMKDNEIIKALECCMKDDCDNCPNGFGNCEHNLAEASLDLINRLKAENTDLFYKLTGVMHSVDKWLDGDELKQDEVNRAITMREKTLQITEKQQAEIRRLNKEANKEQLRRQMYRSTVDEIKSEAIKEFAERLKGKFLGEYKTPRAVIKGRIDNLVKEMTEVNENGKV